jgi:hypothetical protein
VAGGGAFGTFKACRSFAVAFDLPCAALVACGGDAITRLGRERLVARTSGSRTEWSEGTSHACCHFLQNKKKEEQTGAPKVVCYTKDSKEGEFTGMGI